MKKNGIKISRACPFLFPDGSMGLSCSWNQKTFFPLPPLMESAGFFAQQTGSDQSTAAQDIKAAG